MTLLRKIVSFTEKSIEWSLKKWLKAVALSRCRENVWLKFAGKTS